MIIVWTWGDQFLRMTALQSKKVIMLPRMLNISLNQCYTFRTKEKKWLDVSPLTLHRSQIEGNAKPLHERLSYVGILLCRNLQTKSDMVGGMFLFQGKIDQKTHGLGLFLNYRHASSSGGHYLHSSNQHIIL